MSHFPRQARLLAILTGVIAAAIPASVHAQTPAPSRVPFPERIEIGTSFQSTAARVGDNLLITGQPTADALRELGMKYVYLPMRVDREFPFMPAAVTLFANALEEANGEKVLFHCAVAWRASHLWAAYLVRHQGQLTVADARRQLG